MPGSPRFENNAILPWPCIASLEKIISGIEELVQ